MIQPIRTLSLVLVSCVLLSGGVLFSASQARAAEGERPTIDNVMTTKVYENEGTVEAQINPQGSETAYEIWLECQSAHEPFWPCEPIADGQRIQGHIAPGLEARAVSLHLTDLQPGSHYWYGIVATNSAGESESRGNILVVGVVPPGACPTGCGKNEQYRSEIPGSYGELGSSESDQTVKEYETKHAKELEVAHAKEQEGQRIKEAAKTVEAVALKQREEEEVELAKGSVMLASASITVKSGRISLVKLECFGSAPCSGKLTLVGTATTTSKGKQHTRKAMIGAASFSIPGDAATVVRIDIDAVGRTLLAAARGHLDASLTIDELPPNADGTQTKTVNLAQEKPKARPAPP